MKVQVSFAPAITPAELEATPEAAQDLIENQVWPEVEREFQRLRANPGLIAAIVAGLSAPRAAASPTSSRSRSPSAGSVPPRSKLPAPQEEEPVQNVRR